MKHVLIILALGLGVVCRAVAVDSGLCEDSAKYTCSLGTHDDGTGSVTKDKTDYSDTKQGQAIENEGKVLSKHFSDYLKNSDNSYFRKLAIASFDMNDSPECKSASSSEQQKCTDNVVLNLVDLAKKKMMMPNISNPDGSYGAAGGYGTSVDLSKVMYVLNNEGFKSAINESQKRILGSTLNPDSLKTVRDKMFPQIKALLVKKISALPIDEDKKKMMVEKVKGIYFGGTDCSLIAPGVSEAYTPNAFYSPMEQSFTVCKGMLGNNLSEFNMAMIIGHELSHSIDPCVLSQGPEGVAFKYSPSSNLKQMEGEYPIKGLISCLRSEKSVKAERNQNAASAYAVTTTTSQAGGATTTTTTTSENFCQNDQVPEAVADWFGEDLMADYISANYPNLTKEQWQNGVSNVFRPICFPPGTSFDEHPALEKRVNAILLVNPKVREKMGCMKPQSKYVHCDANNPEAMAQASSAPVAAKTRVEYTIPAPAKTQEGGGVR